MATGDVVPPVSSGESKVQTDSSNPKPEAWKDTKSGPVVVLAVYKFADLSTKYKDMQQPLLEKMHEYGVRGSLLLAGEGINGTISGTREGMDKLLDYIRSFPELAELDYKESIHQEHPFLRSKVRLKKEIVTMGVDGVSPVACAGTYVEPKEWNSLISDPNTILVDTRNDYEIAIGTFKNAVNPNTKTFREFPSYAKENFGDKLGELQTEGKKIAMFCTGGIRCEKSTALLVGQGFDRNQVYHLKGGILKYLEEVDKKDSLWEGECFVFDERISVDHDLKRGKYDACHGCRHPISEEDKKRPEYEFGVTCHHCIHEAGNEKHVERLRERKRQIMLAEQRGTGPHQRDGYNAKKANKAETKPNADAGDKKENAEQVSAVDSKNE